MNCSSRLHCKGPASWLVVIEERGSISNKKMEEVRRRIIINSKVEMNVSGLFGC